MTFLLGMTIGGFVGGGKLVILAGAVEVAPIGVWPLVVMVVFGDTATSRIHALARLPTGGSERWRSTRSALDNGERMNLPTAQRKRGAP